MSQLERQTIKTYLLGRLDHAKLAEVEERLLTDETFYVELLIAEDELTDQYLADELSEEERHSFETHFMAAPERRQKLRFARTLRRYVIEATRRAALESEPLASDQPTAVSLEPRSRKRPFFSFLRRANPVFAYSLAAAVLIGVIGISWAVFNSLKRPPLSARNNVLTVVLTPGPTRGDEIETIQLSSNVDTLKLQLALPSDEYQNYRAELLTSERARVWLRAGIKHESQPKGRLVNLLLPTNLFMNDYYLVKLSGQRADGNYEDTADYVFRVFR